MMKHTHLIIILFIISLFSSSCGTKEDLVNGDDTDPVQIEIKTPPPEGILLTTIPPNADIIISSIRYVLDRPECLDENYQVKERFIQDPECNQLIYKEGRLAVPRQLFTLDIDNGSAVQVTNTECIFLSGQYIDPSTLMTNAICSDNNGDGSITEEDKTDLYLILLSSAEMDCLTCEYELNAINNPDYSSINQKIVFSAQINRVFHNYLFTIDLNKNLHQITNGVDYMDFDCAWSEDANHIAFNRLPSPWFDHPAQIWMMNSDGSGLRKITNGGNNSLGEDIHRQYPIGTDADADLSPDNSHIVFSRLKTGTENTPIGVWELIVVDPQSGTETILDSSYANMIPEWKSEGIIFTRQIGDSDPMHVKQGLHIYKDGTFQALEHYPYDVFPIGAFGGHWIIRDP
jgi:hypothetical protein